MKDVKDKKSHQRLIDLCAQVSDLVRDRDRRIVALEVCCLVLERRLANVEGVLALPPDKVDEA